MRTIKSPSSNCGAQNSNNAIQQRAMAQRLEFAGPRFIVSTWHEILCRRVGPAWCSSGKQISCLRELVRHTQCGGEVRDDGDVGTEDAATPIDDFGVDGINLARVFAVLPDWSVRQPVARSQGHECPVLCSNHSSKFVIGVDIQPTEQMHGGEWRSIVDDLEIFVERNERE